MKKHHVILGSFILFLAWAFLDCMLQGFSFLESVEVILNLTVIWYLGVWFCNAYNDDVRELEEDEYDNDNA